MYNNPKFDMRMNLWPGMIISLMFFIRKNIVHGYDVVRTKLDSKVYKLMPFCMQIQCKIKDISTF